MTMIPPATGRLARSVSLLLTLALAGLAPAAARQPPVPDPEPEPDGRTLGDLVGAWQGVLLAGGVELRLVLEIAPQDDGTYRATMDSVDQGAMDLPVDTVSLENGVVRFAMSRLLASYRGTLSADGSTIDGTFTQGGASLPLTLRRTDEPPTVGRPQDPREPLPYRVEEVTYTNEQSGEPPVRLAGTLTLPEGDGPYPTVVLISGSGPQNRDSFLLGHRPFLVLADHLTRRGIAVLRYDERGIGESTGTLLGVTSVDLAGDVLAGVRYLQSREDVDPERIGLIGHSEGGIIAPMLAADHDEIAFIVMLAGPAVPGREILDRQGRLIAKASGVFPARIEENEAVQQRIYAVLDEEPDDVEAKDRIRRILREHLAKLSELERRALGDVDAHIEAQLQIASPWFRFFLSHDPRLALGRVKCPVLALNGEKDLQVDPRQNLPVIASALAGGACNDYTVSELPRLNHLFQTATTGLRNEYAKIDETFAPIALETISDWILRRVDRFQGSGTPGT